MAVPVKICGLSTQETLDAAVQGGAAWVGLNFYAPSPRSVTPAQAAGLTAAMPEGVSKVGLVVDGDDQMFETILSQVPLDLLQLHGSESPERVAQVKSRFGLPVMKVIQVSGPEDLDTARTYEDVADCFLFDAKPPKDQAGALPGGNALAFDWALLAGQAWSKPWMLAGGLTVHNIAEAVRISGAPALDVSSGVELARGQKSVDKIRAFLTRAQSL